MYASHKHKGLAFVADKPRAATHNVAMNNRLDGLRLGSRFLNKRHQNRLPQNMHVARPRMSHRKD